MNIFFDHQTFSQQTYGGISRYYSELIAGINSTSGNDAYLPLLFSNNVHLREIGMRVSPFFANVKSKKKLQMLYYLNKKYNIHKLETQTYNIFHSTYYDPYFLPHLKRHPFVITFLDMIHEKFGTIFDDLAYDGKITEQKRLLANRADKIIAISESTKRDIVNLLNVNPNKIDVIYLGSSFKLKHYESTHNNLNNPYLLFVGNRGTYKNFMGLLKAIHLLLKKYKIKLLCAGGGPFTKSEKLFIQSIQADGIVEQHYVDDQTLPIFYKNALAFVFPTLYEGFGIPVLEAFSCECPCIVSNVSSLPEVAGDAALYIDPFVPESMYEVIETLINDVNLRQSLIQRGSQQVAKFSWQRTVAETLTLYQTVI